MKHSMNNKILQKIQNENIQPKPKWQFIVKEFLLWIGIFVSLLLASLSAGSMLFNTINANLIPLHLFFWFSGLRILLVGLFVVLAIYQIMNAEQGYKRTRQTYLFIILIVIGLIGSTLFGSRLSGQIERGIGFPGIVTQANEYWSDPEINGLLAGELQEITNNGLLLFNSLDDGIHIIDAQFIREDDANLFIESLRVKMVGYQDSGIFYPCAVAPWKLKRGGFEKHSEYKNLRDGNINFVKDRGLGSNFNKTFERKNEILRTNSC
jgi:hypothetical protein